MPRRPPIVSRKNAGPSARHLPDPKKKRIFDCAEDAPPRRIAGLHSPSAFSHPWLCRRYGGSANRKHKFAFAFSFFASLASPKIRWLGKSQTQVCICPRFFVSLASPKIRSLGKSQTQVCICPRLFRILGFAEDTVARQIANTSLHLPSLFRIFVHYSTNETSTER